MYFEVTTRRFEDKSIDLVRRSLKLYEFSRPGNRKSGNPQRIVELSDEELSFRAGLHDQDRTPNTSPTPSRRSNRAEVGVIPTLPQDPTDDEDALYSEEMAPSVYMMPKNTGPWPIRTPMARTGFAVPLSEVDCGKQLQKALNRAKHYCHFKRFVKGSCLMTLHDGQAGKTIGTARAIFGKYSTEEDADGDSEEKSTVFLDVALASSPSVQKILLLLFACVRYHFEMYFREESQGKVSTSTITSTSTQGGQRRAGSSDTVFELLGGGQEKLAPGRTISTSLIMAAGLDKRRQSTTGSSVIGDDDESAFHQARFKRTCNCSSKIDKLLLEWRAFIEDMGHETLYEVRDGIHTFEVGLVSREDKQLWVRVGLRKAPYGVLMFPLGASQVEVSGALPRKKHEKECVEEFWGLLVEEFSRRKARPLFGAR